MTVLSGNFCRHSSKEGHFLYPVTTCGKKWNTNLCDVIYGRPSRMNIAAHLQNTNELVNVDVVVVNVVVVRNVVIVVNVDDTFKPLNYNIYGLQNALSRGKIFLLIFFRQHACTDGSAVRQEVRSMVRSPRQIIG